MKRALLAAAFALVAAGGGQTRAASTSSVGAGPRERAMPDDAVVAADAEQLEQMIADPNGPQTIALRASTYRGDFVVKRPLAIVGARGAILEGTGTQTVLAIAANDVSIANVVVRRSGRRSTTEDAGIKATGERVRVEDVRVEDTLFGVSLQACHDCALERVAVVGTDDPSELRGDGIKLWESHGSTVRGCLVERSRDVVVWYTRRAVVEDNVVKNSRYGTHFMYAHDGVARHNRYENDTVGVFVMYSMRVELERNVLAGGRGAAGMGIGFKESDAVRVRGNWIVANTTGLYFDFTPRTPDQPVFVEDNVLALNDAALRLHSVERGVTFRRNDFRDNAETIEVDGGGDALACDVRGNHFSEYEGYDLDGDGIGDVPHRVSALSSELSDARPTLKFFHGTAAMQLADAVAHAVPVLERRTLLVDEAPLFRAPEVSSP